MRSFLLLSLPVSALALVLRSPSAPPAAEPAASGFAVQRLAEGVYALIRTEPLGVMFEANATVILAGDELIVVDGGSNPVSARAALAEIRRLTDRPVRYVVNTHWHDDHMLGNEVYREAFAGVEFIAHATAIEDAVGPATTNRSQFLKALPGTIAYFRGLIEQGKAMDGGGPLSAVERESHLSSIALWERLLAAAPTLQPTVPTLPVHDRLTLERGGRTVEILHLGRGHTRGDLVVHLPRERIVIAGDLVVWPVPAIGSTSYPADLGPTLERLLALEPAVIVPGHGAVLRDPGYVRAVVRLVGSLSRQVEAAVARGATLEEARKSTDLEEHRRAFAGEDPVRNLFFKHYVALPAVARAFELAAVRPEQGEGRAQSGSAASQRGSKGTS